MAEENENKELDFENMSDEDFLKLDQEGISENNEEESSENENNDENQNGNSDDEEENENEESNSDDENDSNSANDDENSESNKEEENSEENSNDSEANSDPMAVDSKSEKQTPKPDDEKNKQPESNTEEKGKDSNKQGSENDLTPEQMESAKAFFLKVTAPFKADGREITVRSPEDAVRLMQQGINYSRRMEELKPIKTLNRMLSDHGLADESKISFLIDVSKGDKKAITKLLKDKGLDPLDLDTSEEIGYQAKSYAGNPAEETFRDALETTMASPDGKAFVGEIQQSWDIASKVKLQEDPSLLGTLLEMKQTGVYGKIVDEIEYQKSLGYLNNTPFLQAFDVVGEAMKKAGAFGDNTQPAPAAVPMGQLQVQNPPQGQPVASGARKDQGTKKPDPNPHLSSTPPSKQTNNPVKDDSPDFSNLSDEDFMKMAPPS